MRWLLSALAVLLGVGIAYVAYLNDGDVTIRLTPSQTLTVPITAALVTSFALGVSVVAFLSLIGALRRGWRRAHDRRLARREQKRVRQTERARELVWTGNYDRARAELLRSDRGLPAELVRIELLAETYLQENNLDGARLLLQNALDRLGAEPHLLDLLADVADRSNDTRLAIDAAERARRAQPDSPRLTRHLRDLYVRDERWQDALALQQDLLLKVKSPAAGADERGRLRGLRYQAASHGDDPDQAAKMLQTLAYETPDFLPAWVSAGDLFLKAGRPAKARKVWERGVEHRPAAILLERLEELNAGEKIPERTTKLYRRLLRRHPAERLLPLLFARHLLALGEKDLAAAVLEEAGAAGSSSPAATALWAESLRQHGRHDEAASAFARALGPGLGLSGPFACRQCSAIQPQWDATCGSCGAWGTLDLAAGSGGRSQPS
jgi:predicted Zn-dependent protease